MKIIIYNKIIVARDMNCLKDDIFNKQSEESI